MGIKKEDKKKSLKRTKKDNNMDFQRKVDNDLDDCAHQKLLNSIKTMDKIKNKTKLRSEPSLNPSEFNITKINSFKDENLDDINNNSVPDEGTSMVEMDDLFSSYYELNTNSHRPFSKQKNKKVGSTKINKELSNKVKVLSRRLKMATPDNGMVLVPPPTKPVLEKAKMTAGYETVVEDVINKWEDVVKANRIKEFIKFPLPNPDVQIIRGVASKVEASLRNPNQEDGGGKFGKTEFEMELEACLKGSQNNILPGQEYTPAEEQFLKAMSLEEAQARCKDLAKYRALVSYKQQKARHQNKIKSKKYRRLLRKERTKKETQEMEDLKSNNKSAYALRLKKLEEQRVQERMSLRHKNTGRWARNMLTQAKRDPTAKAALQEQFRLGKQLTKKGETGDESDRDGDQIDGGDQDFALNVESVPGAFAIFGSKDSTLGKVFEEEMYQNVSSLDDYNPWTVVAPKNGHKGMEGKEKWRNKGPAAAEGGSKSVLGEPDGPIIDETCFGHDDACVVPELEDNLPNTKTVPTKEEIDGAQNARKDRHLKFVLINEEKDKKISELQVSQIPHPFTNVKHFESTLRNPIGSMWNPQCVVKELTKPKIMTKMGTIIKPIDSSHLLRLRKKS